jgi:CHAT domain-containing protein
LWAVQNPTEDLDYADLEVSAIQSTFLSSQILTGREATKTALMTSQDLTQAHCAHFACHGIFHLESPLESALLLAQEESDKPLQQDRLLLGEIFELDLRQCSLVTLSACETGLTDFTVLSDEYVGLPSGFIYAGTSCLVSSLWTVSDVSTAILMGQFYENLQSQMGVVVALNQAQRWLRDATGDELNQWIKERQFPLSNTLKLLLRRRFNQERQPFQSLYYWAAFCVIGQ